MTWIEYFLRIAQVVALKSKDPSTKVGCVIVDADNRPVSFGFNGFVGGCDESQMTQERPLKYLLVCHAEMNALTFAKRDLHGCIVFCTHSPCSNCLKHLLQAGIRDFYYLNDSLDLRATEDEREAKRRLILASGAAVVKINLENTCGTTLKSEI